MMKYSFGSSLDLDKLNILSSGHLTFSDCILTLDFGRCFSSNTYSNSFSEKSIGYLIIYYLAKLILLYDVSLNGHGIMSDMLLGRNAYFDIDRKTIKLKGEGVTPLTSLTPPHFCTCPMSIPGYPTPCVVVYFSVKMFK